MKKIAISYSVSRRRFLRDATLTSLGIVAAACTPAGTSPSPSGSGAASTKGGEFHGAWPYDLPPKGHFNYFASAGIILQGAIYIDLFMPPLATWMWNDAKWNYMLAESSSLSGNVFSVKLRPNIKWSDGTAFSSKDVVTTFTIGRMESFTIWNYINKVEADGDLGVKFTYKNPSSLGERNILRVSIRPDSVYGAIAKKAADLYTAGKDNASDEIKALRTEKDNLRPDPISVGPYKIDKNSVTEAQLTMVRNDAGLFGSQVNFDKVIVYQGETAQVTPLVLAGDVDYATHGFPLATDKAFVDAGIRVVRGPGYTGPAIYFHWEKAAAFQDKRLRQAVAYAINKDESAKVTYGDSAKTQKYMAGFSDNLVPQWLSSADLGQLTGTRRWTASTRRTGRSSSSRCTRRATSPTGRAPRTMLRRRSTTSALRSCRAARSAASSSPMSTPATSRSRSWPGASATRTRRAPSFKPSARTTPSRRAAA
jgi:peptide/nickel transport system substrate-binding protein